MPWFVYILRCADDTLYTGITTEPARRVDEHNTDNALGARYTRSRRPVSLVYSEELDSRSAAAKREAELKKMERQQKLALVSGCKATATP